MFLFSLASSRRLHRILAMYLFFTAMLVNVLVFAAPPPKAPTPPTLSTLVKYTIRLGRRVGTTGPFLSNNIDFAPDQQLVLFVGHGAYQYNAGKVLYETVAFDPSGKHVAPYSSHSQNQEDSNFIKLGTDRVQDIFIELDGEEILTARIVHPYHSLKHIHGSAGLNRLISTVEDLQGVTEYQINSNLQYVDQVFMVLADLERADGKTKLLKPEDCREWAKIFNVKRAQSLGVGTVSVSAHPPPATVTKYTIRLGRRVGTHEQLLSNKIDFAPNQQFVLFIGDHIALQYHRNAGKASKYENLVDFSAFPIPFGSSLPHPDSPFIRLGPNRRQDLSIELDTSRTMTVKMRDDSTMYIRSLAQFWELIESVEDLRKIISFPIISDLDWVNAVFEVLGRLVRADGKTQVLKVEDAREWRKIYAEHYPRRPCIPIYPPIHLSIHLSISTYLPIYPFIQTTHSQKNPPSSPSSPDEESEERDDEADRTGADTTGGREEGGREEEADGADERSGAG
ncbi:hypothetical protein F5879DRAFT_994496 [Lentinula edodes]|nr:hypothetical protein F5879DRAFT_994496 [Lentinula edodes]